MPIHLAILAPRGAKRVMGATAPKNHHEDQKNQSGAKEKEGVPMLDTSKHDSYKRVKQDAADKLAKLCEESSAPETEKEVHAMLAHAFKYGDCKKAAAVSMQVMRWLWADLEIHEHEE